MVRAQHAQLADAVAAETVSVATLVRAEPTMLAQITKLEAREKKSAPSDVPCRYWHANRARINAASAATRSSHATLRKEEGLPGDQGSRLYGCLTAAVPCGATFDVGGQMGQGEALGGVPGVRACFRIVDPDIR